MKKHFVKTSNYKRFAAAVMATEARGASEAGWVLVTGLPGTGKTKTLKAWAADVGAIYLRAKTEWTVNYFYEEVAAALGLDTGGRARARCGRLEGMLAREQIPIVIDEVEHAFHNKSAVLEALRDLTDVTETLAILAGMEDKRNNVRNAIAKQMQFGHRVFQHCEFRPASSEDTRQLCSELAEVTIADDLATAIHQQSGGVVRLILNAISTAERTARRNSQPSIALADLSGAPLCIDWQARRPAAGGR
ncbi:MAG: ATP-binding protein [Methylococcaceae bacterium]|nr:MAG: ATP-binding protein [Methylococcaceae bacterium]